jgi:hypothetical protein
MLVKAHRLRYSGLAKMLMFQKLVNMPVKMMPPVMWLTPDMVTDLECSLNLVVKKILYNRIKTVKK